ncbi:hypothetical protein ACFWBR_23385 [Streptomyces sp. NPDC060006]|uniref:hypothetical protein n=1 Tax=unclassified Streptomyces TaxID=2593676 RepID=UPI00363481BF
MDPSSACAPRPGAAGPDAPRRRPGRSVGVRGGGTAGLSAEGTGAASAGAPRVSVAEANRSSSESAAGAGPVSPVESSYSCPHQSS